MLSAFFLIARSLGCSQEVAAAVGALMMLGGRVLGVQTLVLEYEPVSRGMAFSLVLLAVALLSRRHFFSGTLLACFGFCIHPTTTLPFWIGWAAILLSGCAAWGGVKRSDRVAATNTASSPTASPSPMAMTPAFSPGP